MLPRRINPQSPCESFYSGKSPGVAFCGLDTVEQAGRTVSLYLTGLKAQQTFLSLSLSSFNSVILPVSNYQIKVSKVTPLSIMC